jgi:hypothetical protein
LIVTDIYFDFVKTGISNQKDRQKDTKIVSMIVRKIYRKIDGKIVEWMDEHTDFKSFVFSPERLIRTARDHRQ